MTFRKSKDDVIEEVAHRVDIIMRKTLHENLAFGVQPPNGPLFDAIMYSVRMGIIEAAATIVRNTYTDEEFENDLGLGDGNEHK